MAFYRVVKKYPKTKDRRFEGVSSKRPCPVCKKTSWCSVSTDGELVVCRRVSAGGVSKKDSANIEYYIHFLGSKTKEGV